MENKRMDSFNKEGVDILEMLRNKTQEEDRNSLLKTSFGGYTKQSVQDYISLLKGNQQSMMECFKNNQDLMLDEKEKLRKCNETLQTRLQKMEEEYRNLADSMMSVQMENKEYTLQDIAAFKCTIAALEEEGKKKESEKALALNQISHLEHEKRTVQDQLSLSNKEIRAYKEMLVAEKQETKVQRNTVTDLLKEMEVKQNELKYWQSLQSEGRQAELTGKIKELAEELEAQGEILARKNEDIEIKTGTITVLNSEIETLKEQADHMNSTHTSLNEQNEKLLQSNHALTELIEEEQKKAIAMIQANSSLKIEKMIAEKKMLEAMDKASLIELQSINRK